MLLKSPLELLLHRLEIFQKKFHSVVLIKCLLFSHSRIVCDAGIVQLWNIFVIKVRLHLCWFTPSNY
jgi:hypothetical protein